jgi:FOG: Ankyrin repeat
LLALGIDPVERKRATTGLTACSIHETLFPMCLLFCNISESDFLMFITLFMKSLLLHFFHSACESGKKPLVKLLLDHGADGRIHPVTRYSPLYIAAFKGNRYPNRYSAVKLSSLGGVERHRAP